MIDPIIDLIKYFGEKLGIIPSKYQAEIFDWITRATGDGVVNAVAGSGKTFTLVNGAKLLAGDAVFIAFSKEIQTTLASKLAGTRMGAKTVHSIGYGVIANYIKNNGKARMKSPDGKKYRNLASKWCAQNQALDACTKELLEEGIIPDFEESLTKLVDFSRLTLTSPTDYSALRLMASKYNIDVQCDDLYAGILPVIQDGAWLALNDGAIDFTDMIWFPYYWQLPTPTYSWVFVDEAQDLSACQLDLVLKCRAKGGRMLFVGDPNQAIFGFAGADNDSFWNIKAATKAQELPLSINYRCPKSHVDAVREKGTVPHIEARPDAPQGIIKDVAYDKLVETVQEGDMILCRLTAPLIALAIELIAARIPARVRGRDIGKELSGLAKKIANKCMVFDQFIDAVDTHERKESSRLARKENNETRIQSLHDKCECLRVIYTSTKVNNLVSLCDEIESLFSDERASITLSTIHRAKGLENPRVFILCPELLPFNYPGQKAWQKQQELHIEYIAMTRALEALFYIRQPQKEAEMIGQMSFAQLEKDLFDIAEKHHGDSPNFVQDAMDIGLKPSPEKLADDDLINTLKTILSFDLDDETTLIPPPPTDDKPADKNDNLPDLGKPDNDIKL